jgi:hypothetical protein
MKKIYPLKYWIHFLNIFPCKVLEVKKVTDSKSVYKIFSKDGKLRGDQNSIFSGYPVSIY